ncbi:hypothetical protein GCM10009118_14310 [Wandonia haliotis]|uniref:Lipoprotein n=1 Tax=Wandonia haliotis TaxID=574963 RepID=A0ABN1MP40_9FLAO
MKILSLTIAILFVACSGTDLQKDYSPSLNSVSNKWIDYELTHHCNNLVKIKTTYSKVDDTISFRGFIVKNQEITIDKDDNTQLRVKLPFEFQTISTGTDSTIVMSTSVSKIQCLNVNGNTIIKLYGTNFFDPHHEFLGLVSLDGDWLWYYYGTMYETYKEFGKKQEWNNKIGEDKISDLNGMINVLPKI